MTTLATLIAQAARLDRLAVYAMSQGYSDDLVNRIFDRADKAWDKVEAIEATTE